MKIVARDIPPRSAWALEQAGVHPLLARLYAARGVLAKEELDDGLARLLAPDTLRGAREAAVLLADAIRDDKRLCIVADYDCDGATACAVAVRGLRLLGAKQVGYLVPDRVVDGYGLTPPIAERVAGQRRRPADHGRQRHRQRRGRGRRQGARPRGAGDRPPPARPRAARGRRAGESQPARLRVREQEHRRRRRDVLRAAGAALRAARARRVRRARHNPSSTRCCRWSRSAPWPTWSGSTPTTAGWSRRACAASAPAPCRPASPRSSRPRAATPQAATTFDFGFALGPRINAAGRLADMTLGIECLLTDDAARADELARTLDGINRERRDIEGGMREQALLLAESLFDDSSEAPPAAISVFDADFHEGVVGIVASRIKDRFHRPTFVFAASGAPGKAHELKGSGRSIPGFHLRDALDLVAKRHPGVLLRFGGHAMAAGCTVAEEHFETFERALAQVALEVARRGRADAPARHRRAAGARVPARRPGRHAAPRGVGPGLRAADLQRGGRGDVAAAGGREASRAQAQAPGQAGGRHLVRPHRAAAAARW